MFSGWLFGQVCRDTVTWGGRGGLFGQVCRDTVMFWGGCLDRYVGILSCFGEAV